MACRSCSSGPSCAASSRMKRVLCFDGGAAAHQGGHERAHPHPEQVLVRLELVGRDDQVDGEGVAVRDPVQVEGGAGRGPMQQVAPEEAQAVLGHPHDAPDHLLRRVDEGPGDLPHVGVVGVPQPMPGELDEVVGGEVQEPAHLGEVPPLLVRLRGHVLDQPGEELLAALVPEEVPGVVLLDPPLRSDASIDASSIDCGPSGSIRSSGLSAEGSAPGDPHGIQQHHLLPQRPPPLSGDRVVLPLGVDDDDGAREAQQGGDDARHPLPRPGRGDGQEVPAAGVQDGGEMLEGPSRGTPPGLPPPVHEADGGRVALVLQGVPHQDAVGQH
jgi:hypothetical protein